MKTNRKDLRKLCSILNTAELLESRCKGLSDETKDFLEEEFIGGTVLRLRNFKQNISETINEMKKEISPKRK